MNKPKCVIVGNIAIYKAKLDCGCQQLHTGDVVIINPDCIEHGGKNEEIPGSS